MRAEYDTAAAVDGGVDRNGFLRAQRDRVGFGPQLNVIAPNSPANAALSAASVQLSDVPAPTTPAAWGRRGLQSYGYEQGAKHGCCK